MNPRLQVEHPVTEAGHREWTWSANVLVTLGEPLDFSQADVSLKRTCGRMPDHRTGSRAWTWRPPPGTGSPAGGRRQPAGLRLDSHIYEGYLFPPFYDALMGKRIVWAPDRAAGVERMEHALAAFAVEGSPRRCPYCGDPWPTRITGTTPSPRTGSNEIAHPGKGARMTEIRLVDVSLRDGNQSIWGATGVTTRMVEGVIPDLDQVGYHALELATSTLLATAVRYHREDPLERLRAARNRIPNTRSVSSPPANGSSPSTAPRTPSLNWPSSCWPATASSGCG